METKVKFNGSWGLEDAQAVAMRCKVPPKEVYYEVESVKKLNDVIGGVKGALHVQMKLNEASIAGTLPSAEPGIKSQIAYWDGDDGLVLGYDPMGAMVGYGKVHKHPQSDEFDPNGYTSTYIAEYVVVPTYEGNGMATHLMNHLENSIAVNNTGIGVTMFYDVQAETPESKTAAIRLIQKADAIAPIQIHPYYCRTIIKKDMVKMVRTGEAGLQLVNQSATGKVQMY